MSFKLRYWAELRSKYKGIFWRVEIAERGYQGSAEEMAFNCTAFVFLHVARYSPNKFDYTLAPQRRLMALIRCRLRGV